MSQIQVQRKSKTRFSKMISQFRNDSTYASFVKWYMDQHDMICLKNCKQILLKMEHKNCGEYMFQSFNSLWYKFYKEKPDKHHSCQQQKEICE